MAARDISFGSFNLLNLQVAGDRIYGDSDGWPSDVYDKKLDFTAQTLTRLEADVVGLQELWARAAIDAAITRAGMGDSHEVLVPPDHPGTHIVCGAVMRKDLRVGDANWITDFPEECVLHSGGDDPQQADISVSLSSFSRPVLHVTVQPHVGVPPIHVFVCHFKSRRPTQIWRERSWYEKDVHGPHANALGYAISTVRRTAEAAALRVLITKITKNTDEPAVVLGDMNDAKLSNTLNILTEQPGYLSPLARGGGDNALYTAQMMQEYRSLRDVYYTHVYKGQRESLDHVLFSEQFYDNSRKRLWAFDEMIVMNDHLNLEDHKTSGTNDHGILRVGFKWKPERRNEA